MPRADLEEVGQGHAGGSAINQFAGLESGERYVDQRKTWQSADVLD